MTHTLRMEDHSCGGGRVRRGECRVKAAAEKKKGKRLQDRNRNCRKKISCDQRGGGEGVHVNQAL